MVGEQIRQVSRRRFVRVCGWIIFALGLIGVAVFGFSAANTNTMVRAIEKVERKQLEDRGMIVADEEEFAAKLEKMRVGWGRTNAIMATVGGAMAVCGFFLGLFRATLPMSFALLSIYVISTVIILIEVAPDINPVAFLWRFGMIYLFSHILYVVIAFQRQERKLLAEAEQASAYAAY